MNLLQSDNTYEELIQQMERCGYSPYHIQRVKREIKWLSKNQDGYGISSYEEACRLRSLETESAEMKEQFRAIMSDDQKAVFEKYTDCIREFQTITDCLIFQNSFKLGARIAFEVMAGP